MAASALSTRWNNSTYIRFSLKDVTILSVGALNIPLTVYDTKLIFNKLSEYLQFNLEYDDISDDVFERYILKLLKRGILTETFTETKNLFSFKLSEKGQEEYEKLLNFYDLLNYSINLVKNTFGILKPVNPL